MVCLDRLIGYVNAERVIVEGKWRKKILYPKAAIKEGNMTYCVVRNRSSFYGSDVQSEF